MSVAKSNYNALRRVCHFYVVLLDIWYFTVEEQLPCTEEQEKKATRKRQQERQQKLQRYQKLSSPIDLDVFDETFKDKTPDEKEDFIFDILMKYNKSHKIFSCKSYLCHTFEKFSKHASNSFICKYNECIVNLTFHVKYRPSVLNLMRKNLLEMICRL